MLHSIITMTIRNHIRSSISRTRLLEAARGNLEESRLEKSTSLRSLRCFPLQRHHVQPSPPTPSDFHASLCDLIRQAKSRVTLASLYIGPAADDVYEKEVELLDALRTASSNNVNVTILLDQHRALRPVPIKGGSKTTTSAKACKQAIAESGRIHLLSVLPPLLNRILPNPYNEVAGVFHIKAYIIDDHLFLSGANLSEEYFVDRVDRYIWITCPDLVQCYQDVVDALCRHGVEYTEQGLWKPQITRRQLVDSLRDILTTKEPEIHDVDKYHGQSDPVAYAVPTFHAPPSYFRKLNMFRSDQQAIHGLLKEAARQQQDSDRKVAARIATAYLNPTKDFLKTLGPLQKNYFLTAGRMSHGFKPKAKAGNKGKDWIPTVFEHSAQLASKQLENMVVSYYQRLGWSFHAKGIWLTNHQPLRSLPDGESRHKNEIRLPSDAHVYAVTHGSSNYGQRSAHRDMESNLLLVLPESSPLAKEHIEEWNALCDFAVSAAEEGTRPIQPQIKRAFPMIRYFF
jgi:CDP-diacylglycerol--glycerol-3-phosphate 3-phosphatidyltransferase